MSNIFNKKNKIENTTYDDVSSLSHTKWNCKYHIVFTPKYRRKIFYGQKRMEIGKILRDLCDTITFSPKVKVQSLLADSPSPFIKYACPLL